MVNEEHPRPVTDPQRTTSQHPPHLEGLRARAATDDSCAPSAECPDAYNTSGSMASEPPRPPSGPKLGPKLGFDESEQKEFTRALRQGLLVQTPLQVRAWPCLYRLGAWACFHSHQGSQLGPECMEAVHCQQTCCVCSNLCCHACRAGPAGDAFLSDAAAGRPVCRPVSTGG